MDFGAIGAAVAQQAAQPSGQVGGNVASLQQQITALEAQLASLKQQLAAAQSTPASGNTGQSVAGVFAPAPLQTTTTNGPTSSIQPVQQGAQAQSFNGNLTNGLVQGWGNIAQTFGMKMSPELQAAYDRQQQNAASATNATVANSMFFSDRHLKTRIRSWK
jgi:hypothetical protein